MFCPTDSAKAMCNLEATLLTGGVRRLAANDTSLYLVNAEGLKKLGLPDLPLEGAALGVEEQALATENGTTDSVYVLSVSGELVRQTLIVGTWSPSPIAGSYVRLLPSGRAVGVVEKLAQESYRACRVSSLADPLCYLDPVLDPALFTTNRQRLLWLKTTALTGIHLGAQTTNAAPANVQFGEIRAFAASETQAFLAPKDNTTSSLDRYDIQYTQHSVLGPGHLVTALFVDGPIVYWSEAFAGADRSFRCVASDCEASQEPLGSALLQAFTANTTDIYFVLENQAVTKVRRTPE